MSPAKQAHSLLSEPPGKLRYNVSAMEIVEMSGKFKLCFLEYHGIFPTNIFHAHCWNKKEYTWHHTGLVGLAADLSCS